MFWKFNLNDEIKVKLNHKGYRRLTDIHNSYVGIILKFKIRDINYYKQQADENGYTAFQAWEFIEIFGKEIGIGSYKYFDNTILIEDKNLK